MTSRFLAASRGMMFALALSIAGQAPAQAPAKAKAAPARGDAAKPDEPKPKLEKATFGGGCFWCQEAVFERIPGVKNVVSGYAGGHVARPSYEMVSTGLTGHAEVIQIDFDPAVVAFDDLLKVFWQSHDPTTLNRQGPDEGTQYRSIILYQNEEQKKAAQKSYETLTAAQVFPNPIVTQLVPLTRFYPAERHHQNYFRSHRNEEYCQTEIAPKVRNLQRVLESLKAKPKAKAEIAPPAP